MIYDASIQPLKPMVLIDLEGGAGDIGPCLRRLGVPEPAAGRVTRAGPLEVLRAGREHWFVRGPLAEEDRLMSTLLEATPPPDTLIVAVSDAYVFLASRARTRERCWP